MKAGFTLACAVLLLTGCVTGDKVRGGIREGMTKDQVIATYSDPSQKAVMQPPFELKYEVDTKTVDMGGHAPAEIRQVYVYIEEINPEKK